MAIYSYHSARRASAYKWFFNVFVNNHPLLMLTKLCFPLCQHDLFTPQAVRTASVLRLMSAAHAGEALLSPFFLPYIIYNKVLNSVHLDLRQRV